MAIIKGRVEAAAILGVAASTLREWMGEIGFPDTSKGHDIEAIRKWRTERGLKGGASDSTFAKLRVATEAEKLKQARTKTTRDEIKLKQLEAHLLVRRSAELVISTLLTEAADDLDQLVNTFPGTCGVPIKYQRAMRARLKTELDNYRARTVDRCQAALKSLDEQSSDEARA